MLKKMQTRFIKAAMSAFGLVMIVLVVGINLVNYMQMAASQDGVLNRIHDYNRKIDSQPEKNFPPISDMAWTGGPEAEFTKRFFVVRCDEEGRVTLFDRDYISSIDEQMAEEYSRNIMFQNRLRGYYKDYRYHVKRLESGYEIIFLNVADSMEFRRTLMIVSFVIAVTSFAIVSVLVVLLSQKAIRPYAKNIERQKQFITDAGHELKTPITSIVTSVDILSDECKESEWVENIQKQAARLTRLVNDLVALSRLDEDMPLPDMVKFSLSEAAWEISESISVLAKAKGKLYEQSIEDNLEMVGDCSTIQQLLSILLENAVKYSDEGGRIRMDIRRRYGRIWIEVYNTCELEDDSDVERWFDRFYRPDRSRCAHTGGTGIGLSMAQAIAEVHGGKISVRSQNGKEIIFKVVL